MSSLLLPSRKRSPCLLSDMRLTYYFVLILAFTFQVFLQVKNNAKNEFCRRSSLGVRFTARKCFESSYISMCKQCFYTTAQANVHTTRERALTRVHIERVLWLVNGSWTTKRMLCIGWRLDRENVICLTLSTWFLWNTWGEAWILNSGMAQNLGYSQKLFLLNKLKSIVTWTRLITLRILAVFVLSFKLA